MQLSGLLGEAALRNRNIAPGSGLSSAYRRLECAAGGLAVRGTEADEKRPPAAGPLDRHREPRHRYALVPAAGGQAVGRGAHLDILEARGEDRRPAALAVATSTSLAPSTSAVRCSTSLSAVPVREEEHCRRDGFTPAESTDWR